MAKGKLLLPTSPMADHLSCWLAGFRHNPRVYRGIASSGQPAPSCSPLLRLTCRSLNQAGNSVTSFEASQSPPAGGFSTVQGGRPWLAFFGGPRWKRRRSCAAWAVKAPSSGRSQSDELGLMFLHLSGLAVCRTEFGLAHRIYSLLHDRVLQFIGFDYSPFNCIKCVLLAR